MDSTDSEVRFSLKNVAFERKKGSDIREPKKLGTYSIKKNIKEKSNTFLDDDSNIMYLHMPKNQNIYYDLSNGYDSDVCWGTAGSNGLEHLLHWTLNHRDQFKLSSETNPGPELHTDFICYRGTLVTIMTTPYEKSEDWLIRATKYNGTTYLCLCPTKKRIEREQNRSDFENKLCYGGYRFEKYITSSSKEKPPEKTSKVDRDELCCVVRSRLNNHSLVYGAEMDCIDPSISPVNPTSLKNYIEIKTTKKMTNNKQYEFFCKLKLLKWWSQSYLVGINKIVCGYRDNGTIVRRIDYYNVRELPHLGRNYWSPYVCLNFLDNFLKFISECLIDDPNLVYEFYYQPGSDIICKKVPKTNENLILPDWYIQEFQKK